MHAAQSSLQQADAVAARIIVYLLLPQASANCQPTQSLDLEVG